MSVLGNLAAVDEIPLVPEGTGTVRALSRIGYDLEAALADVIDNSIDARASRVEVTFFRSDREITAITIADDGDGMNAEDLRRGMQFAGRTDHTPERLGAYGMGLKTASFSQCRTLTVLSRRGGETVAARWAAERIGADWICELLDPRGAAASFNERSLAGQTPATGTVIVWERLERLGVGAGVDALDEFLGILLPRLQAHLGLTFHRFIDAGLKLSLIVRHERRTLAVPRIVKALDPFGYRISGADGWPKDLTTDFPGLGNLTLTAHVWPYGSQTDNFLLGSPRGGRFGGFYFYRNNRLIQAGGWNGVIRSDPDPELTLTRVAVELPPGTLDVTVQKSALQVTAAQSAALKAADADGINIDHYLGVARAVWRAGRRSAQINAAAVAVPGHGFPAGARRAARRRLAGEGPAEEIEFVWEQLQEGRVFDVDPVRDRIVLNRDYRHALLDGASASGADAPFLKLLLFLLFRDEFGRLRTSKKLRERIELCNALMFDVVKTR